MLDHGPLPVLTTTDALDAFCRSLAGERFVTVDTEFIRENTYYPKLCLVQLAGSGDRVAAVDPLAEGIDLAPLFDLMAAPSILKVFHSARQDVEIFVNLAGAPPAPLFDTQVAAMVCGFGEQVGYERLVQKLADARLDKSSRYTDWARRPLTDRQIQYALSDVTYLRQCFEALDQILTERGRGHWVDDEMAALTDSATYRVEPRDAWRRIKTRSSDGKFLAVLRELAAWREEEAQRRDQPKTRVLKDDSLMEIASHAPRTVEDLARTRGLSDGMAAGRIGKAVLEAVEAGLAVPKSDRPKVPKRAESPPGLGPVVELLKVLLRLKAEEAEVAPRLIASADDLERIAADDTADVPALTGWRREVFGAQALALKAGDVALAIQGGAIRIVEAA